MFCYGLNHSMRLHADSLQAKNKHLDTLSTIARSIASDINALPFIKLSLYRTHSSHCDILTSENVYLIFPFACLFFTATRHFFYLNINTNTFWTSAFFCIKEIWMKKWAQHISHNQHFYHCYCLTHWKNSKENSDQKWHNLIHWKKTAFKHKLSSDNYRPIKNT